VSRVRPHATTNRNSPSDPESHCRNRHAAHAGRNRARARVQVRQLKDILREQLGLPLIGRVAAGKPILAEENIEARFNIDPDIFSPRPHYLLKVTGMSMKDAGILDGDLVAVHRTPEVRNRQIIVARLENEVTVKRYKQEGPTVWLLPENPDFEPIRVNLREEPLIIEGVVVGVLRRGATGGKAASAGLM
jgi:repressor LexA